MSQTEGQQVQRPWKWEEGKRLLTALQGRREDLCGQLGGHGVRTMGKKPMGLVLAPSDSRAADGQQQGVG